MNDSSVVVITGATSGVGRATAREFAKEGASVALLARGSDALKATAEEVHTLGGSAIDLPGDVARADYVESAAETVEEELGPIDVWVNNAMTSVFSPVRLTTADEFKRVTEVTYLGVVYGSLAALRRMLPRNQGSLVQVGSALAYRGIPLQAAYCASKHAIQGFVDSLRCELLHDGSNVHVTMVQLPGLNTPQFDVVKSRLSKKAMPVPPIYQPEVAAKAIVWASKHRRREVWVGASTAATILANRVAPGVLDRYLAKTNIDAQQTEVDDDPDRPNNLWEPVAADRGAHGRFDHVAKAKSQQLWAATHRMVAAGLVGLVATTAITLKRHVD